MPATASPKARNQHQLPPSPRSPSPPKGPARTVDMQGDICILCMEPLALLNRGVVILCPACPTGQAHVRCYQKRPSGMPSRCVSGATCGAKWPHFPAPSSATDHSKSPPPRRSLLPPNRQRTRSAGTQTEQEFDSIPNKSEEEEEKLYKMGAMERELAALRAKVKAYEQGERNRLGMSVSPSKRGQAPARGRASAVPTGRNSPKK